jgi:AraC-like DNA-binding protein
MNPGRITRQIRYPSGQVITLESVQGRNSAFLVEGPATTIQCLWGEIRVSSPELGNIPLGRGDMLSWPSGALEVLSGPGALGLIAHGQPAALRRLGSMWDEPNWTGDTLVTNYQRTPTAYRAAFLKLMRRMRASENDLDPASVPGFIDGVARYRTTLGARLASTPGRTLRSKQRGFERLVRVRLQVLMQPQRKWTLAEMAAQAKYSPWHFQRAFVSVFDESPHEFVQDVRLRLGRKLLAQPHLSIADVATAVGYESHSNFTRIIKQRHGVTANELRRSLPAPRRSSIDDRLRS